MRCFPRLTLAGVLLSLLFSSTSFGQSTFGSITGSVMDPSGAVVAGAEVLIINQGTGLTRRVTTTSAGVFNVPSLDLGTYKVRISMQGFATYERTDLVLNANQIINIEAHLILGKTANVVEVQAASPVIATETSDISDSMTSKSAQAMPLVARHAADDGVYGYTTLATGTATAGATKTSVPVIQGARVETGTMATMDGISVMAYWEGASPVSMDMEMVQEIKMETAVAPAEFPTAANVQVVSRSGSNAWHGAAFEDYNGNALNARDFFSTTTPWRVYNNFGASGGGAILKNKLFFFGDYEGSREAAQGNLLESVPTAAWRGGNLSSQLNTSVQTGTDSCGNAIYKGAITNPATGCVFVGNIIPSGISSVSQAIQNYIFPLPNIGPAGALVNNWTQNVFSQTGFTRYNRIDARVDYDLNSRNTIYGRIAWLRAPYFSAGVYPLDRIQTRYAQDATISYNHTFSPTAINEFRVGANYHRNFFEANVIGSNLLQQFGITGVTTAGVPTAPYFGITGFTAFNPSSGADYYNNNPDATFEAIDDLSWTRGRHFMKFGFDAVRERYNGNSINYPAYGQYNFTGVYTGTGYADFLLGIPQTTLLSIPSPNRAFRGSTFGMFAQDQFKVSNSLTVNYGVRWELPMPYDDANGQIYSYDPATGGLVVPDKGFHLLNAFYPKNIPVITASQAHFPANSLINADYKNFEPRIGFAYKLFGSDKSVVRGGYGIYSNLIYSSLGASLAGGPFAGSETFYNSITGGVPAFSFPSPFLPTGTTATQTAIGVNPNIRTPYTQQWNLSVERQVGSYGFRASYVGTRTVKLTYQKNVNEPAPSLTPFSTSLFPNQLFSTIDYIENGANDSYNALELLAQKKIGRSLTFNSGFTWAKDLTDAQDATGGGNAAYSQQLQNQFCLACEKSNNELVPPRRFFTYAVYALPVGRGLHFLPNAHGIVQGVLGGWQTSWVGVLQSGQYFSPSFSGFDPSNTGVTGGVPDRLSGAPLYPAHQTISDWFNAAAFAIPGCTASDPICTNTKDFTAPGRFGTSGWNYILGPPTRNLDFSLSKDFQVRDRAVIRFSANFDDALNHPFFSNPSTVINTTSSVGVISGDHSPLIGEPGSRQIDFVLRVMF